MCVRVSSQESERSCICVLGVSSQESERSCICVLEVSSQESERSCICVLGYQARKVSGNVYVYMCINFVSLYNFFIRFLELFQEGYFMFFILYICVFYIFSNNKTVGLQIKQWTPWKWNNEYAISNKDQRQVVLKSNIQVMCTFFCHIQTHLYS